MDMTDLVINAITLLEQMQTNDGHFYYAKEGGVGDGRRKELANYLYKLGLK